MTKDKTVTISRELLERCTRTIMKPRDETVQRRALNELRAVLAQEAGPVVERQPVAWQYRVSAGPATGWILWHDGKGEEFKLSYQVETRPLYTAPVAVVLPARRYIFEKDYDDEDRSYSMGWNACLDKLKELNQ